MALAVDYDLPTASFVTESVLWEPGIGSEKRGEVQRPVRVGGPSTADDIGGGGWRWESGSAFGWKRKRRPGRTLTWGGA